MTYGELQARVIAWMHRNDLQDRAPEFIDQARMRINRRFGTEYPRLVNATDTNESLAEHADMWLFASLVEGYQFVHNGPAAQTYDMRYGAAADQVNITAHPADAPLAIGIYDGT